MNEILFRAMGSEIFCAVDSDHPRVAARLGNVPAMFEAWEKILSRFRPDSELSQLNAQRGQPLRVSETLGHVLQLAQRAEQWSDGLVTPRVLEALERAGYDKSFENMQIQGVAAQRSLSSQIWSMNPATSPVTVADGARLDLGGVAKGWAAEQTALFLGELGSAMVDAGGDMVFTAPPAEGMWQVGIENPFVPEEDATLPALQLAVGAVATSGRDFRKWKHNGQTAHHLIDPRTGLPAVTDVLTATVMAPTIFQAEVAAKVVLILGSAEGMLWLAAQADLAALLILDDGAVRMNERMESQIL